MRKKFKKIMSGQKSTVRLGIALVYLILIFISLYFIAFFTVAGHALLRLWAHASVFVVFIDLVLFELLAGVIVGSFVYFSFCCGCFCPMVVVLIIEVVRNIKNLTN